ncbi:PH domain-containing protein [Streptomycetaceae bacterium NBC_01309]
MPVLREFRVSDRTWRRTLLLMPLTAVPPLLTAVADAEGLIPGWAKALIFAGFLAVAGLTLLWIKRLATFVTDTHLEVRGLLRTKRVAWVHVQDVTLEDNVFAGMGQRGVTPETRIVVYDARARRYVLPWADDKNVSDVRLTQQDLREAWGQNRGPSWVFDEHLRGRIGPGHWHNILARSWAQFTFGAIAGMILAFVLLFRGSGPIVFLAVPVCGALAAAVTAGVQIRRHRTPARPTAARP